MRQWCSRPLISRSTRPACSRTITCLEIALSETGKGLAILVMVAGRSASACKMARRGASPRAEKTCSSLAGRKYSSIRLNVIRRPPVCQRQKNQRQSSVEGLTSDGGPVMTANSGAMGADVDLPKYRRHPVVASSLTCGAVERSVRDDRRYAQPDSQSAQVG